MLEKQEIGGIYSETKIFKFKHNWDKAKLIDNFTANLSVLMENGFYFDVDNGGDGVIRTRFNCLSAMFVEDACYKAGSLMLPFVFYNERKGKKCNLAFSMILYEQKRTFDARTWIASNRQSTFNFRRSSQLEKRGFKMVPGTFINLRIPPFVG